MLKVYSHPRSGTHFLEAFLAKNFYPNRDLSIQPIEWGHWSDRKVKNEGNPYGRLFGSHKFPHWRLMLSLNNKMYIYRDGRAVAYSLWNSSGFLHPEIAECSFSEFLRTSLDWKGSPKKRSEIEWTIAEHWYHHVHAWHRAWIPRLMIIRYEDLWLDPQRVYQRICNRFFQDKTKEEIKTISEPVGINPNEGSIDAWQEVFTKEDEQFFVDQLPNEDYLFNP